MPRTSNDTLLKPRSHGLKDRALAMGHTVQTALGAGIRAGTIQKQCCVLADWRYHYPRLFFSPLGCLPTLSDSDLVCEENPKSRKQHEGVALNRPTFSDGHFDVRVGGHGRWPESPGLCPARAWSDTSPSADNEFYRSWGNSSCGRDLDESCQFPARFRRLYALAHRRQSPGAFGAQLYWLHRGLRHLVHSDARQHRQLYQWHLVEGGNVAWYLRPAFLRLRRAAGR